jgi:DNA replication protein DnaC
MHPARSYCHSVPQRTAFGYLPVAHIGAVLFFQLMNRRYERASTVLTSNKGFEECGEVLGDEVMAAALIEACH